MQSVCCASAPFSKSTSFQLRLVLSLHRHRNPDPAADAQARDPASEILVLHEVQQCHQHPRATRADRMPERDRATALIQFFNVEIQFAHTAKRLHCEDLVDLDSVHIAEIPAGDLAQPANRTDTPAPAA